MAHEIGSYSEPHTATIFVGLKCDHDGREYAFHYRIVEHFTKVVDHLMKVGD